MKYIDKTISMDRIAKLFLFVLLNIIIFIPILLKSEVSINSITIISLIQFTLNILILKSFNFKIFSLPILFVVFSYIFHLGHLFLITFNIDVDRPFDVINMVPSDVFIKSCIFVLFSQAFLLLGMIISNLHEIKKNVVSQMDDSREKKIVFKIGLVLFCLGIFPKLYIDISKIILYMSGDYLSTYNINISGIFQTVANFSEAGIIMILIGKQDNKRVAKGIFNIAILYQIGMMMTGNRGPQVVFILSLLYIYFNLIKEVTIKKIIVFGTLGYMGIVFLNFISKIRTANINGFSELSKIFIQLFNETPIFQAMGEFGGTLISLCYSIMFVPSLTTFNGGSTYLNSLLSVMPNIGGILQPFKNDFIFVYSFPSNYRFALGGSYLGELYYNFGMYGTILTIIIGILIGFVGRKLYGAIRNKRWISLSIYMILFPAILMWVRGYFSDMVRGFIWTSILILMINHYMKKRQQN